MKRAGLALLFLVLPMTCPAQDVTIATLDWPPYVDSGMKDKGFNAEIVTEAFKRVGHAAKIEFMDWDTAVARTSQGKYDALFPEFIPGAGKGLPVLHLLLNSLLVFTSARAQSSITVPTKLKTWRRIVKAWSRDPHTDEFDRAAYLNKVESDSDEATSKTAGRGVDLIDIDKLVAQQSSSVNAGSAAQWSSGPPPGHHPLFEVFPRRTPAR
jgi:polar amino acid transport system substrate-binding protein